MELREALEWYWQKDQRLASGLFQEIENVFKEISDKPELFQARYRSIRIRFTKRFSYGIHYTLEDETVFVHAILHTKRRPRG